MGVIFAIDPGPLRSAWVAFSATDPQFPLLDYDTWENDRVMTMLRAGAGLTQEVVIEKVESFGMAVGVEVFETVFWSGRFAEAAHPLFVHRIGRKAVKLHLCHTTKAKDSNVRQALVDRYGGKDTALGRKAAPGPLYGVSGDVWSALAVAVTWHDLHAGEEAA